MFQSTRPRGARQRGMDSPAQSVGFQSTRPRGARLGLSRECCTHRSFNPRAREGRDTTNAACPRPICRFNPRAREGRDPDRVRLPNTASLFQSTRPRGARHDFRAVVRAKASFNPRAREGRDIPCFETRPNHRVSIHAPARGATRHNLIIIAAVLVSIHAPARGATTDSFIRRYAH